MPVAVTHANLKLPSSCKASWSSQWGTMGDECTCGPTAPTHRRAHRRALSL